MQKIKNKETNYSISCQNKYFISNTVSLFFLSSSLHFKDEVWISFLTENVSEQPMACCWIQSFACFVYSPWAKNGSYIFEWIHFKWLYKYLYNILNFISGLIKPKRFSLFLVKKKFISACCKFSNNKIL